MRRAELWRRTFGRSDARAVLAIAGLLLLAMGLLGLLLYAYVAMESLEEADRWMEHSLRVAQRRLSPEPDETSLELLRSALPDAPVALRLRGSDGVDRISLGSWPPARHQVAAAMGNAEERDLSAFRWLRRENFLVGEAALEGGRRLVLAFSLSHFAAETAEVGRGLALIVLGSGLAALFIALGATHRAFAPLRRATSLIGGIDARRLGDRLPTRGTGDPVDRHAETTNAVLASIDEAFSRTRSFSSDAAHELRTPLNRIRNVAEVALMGGDACELAAALESIQRTAEDLSQVVQSLLLLAEIDDRRVPLRASPVDLEAWLSRTAEAWAPLFEERDVKLTVHGAGGTVEADRTLLDRVLLNLLQNALEHASSGGRVDVRCVRADGELVISVDDAGPGIPAEDRDRVFDRFARLDRARRGTGGGLGLALARAIARLHGGDIHVEDSPLGGARFVWWLPV